MVAVVAEGIEHLRQLHVRKTARDRLGRNALARQLDDGTDRRAGASDDRLPTQDLIVGDDVAMSGRPDHGSSLVSTRNHPDHTAVSCQSARRGRLNGATLTTL